MKLKKKKKKWFKYCVDKIIAATETLGKQPNDGSTSLQMQLVEVEEGVPFGLY